MISHKIQWTYTVSGIFYSGLLYRCFSFELLKRTHLITNETREHGNIVYQDSYHAWYKLEKSLFPSLGKAFYICFLYIPPNSSTWFRSGNSYNYDKLMLDFAKYESMGGEVIIVGDMNARIAEEVDFVENTDENA